MLKSLALACRMRHTDRIMELYFILCRPTIPENIGAAARALSTMGFEHLRLVRPCRHLDLRARSMACTGLDVLEHAQVYRSLEDAVADIDIIVGTTAHIRRGRFRYYTPLELSGILQQKKTICARAALVFGTETAGLSAKELAACHLASSIPTPCSKASINLAQAVMVYAYQLSAFSVQHGKRRIHKAPRTASQQVFWKKLHELLRDIEIEEDSPVYHRIMERCSLLDADDVRLAHFVRKAFLRKLKGRQRGL